MHCWKNKYLKPCRSLLPYSAVCYLLYWSIAQRAATALGKRLPVGSVVVDLRFLRKPPNVCAVGVHDVNVYCLAFVVAYKHNLVAIR